MTAADSPQNGFESVAWVGALDGPPCMRHRAPGNFSAQCSEPDASTATVVSAGSEVAWRPATPADVSAAVAGMDAAAPAAGAQGLAAAQAHGRLFVGVPAGGFDWPTQLYDARGFPRTRARFPSPGSYSVWAAPLCPGNLRKKGPCQQQARYGFVYAPGTVLSSYSQPRRTRFVVYHGWTASSHNLRDVDASNRSVLFTNPSDRPIGWWPNHDSEGGGRFYVEAVDYLSAAAAGQWAWSQSVGGILYVARSGEDPASAGPAWSVSRLKSAFNFSAGATSISLSGMSIRHVAWDCDSLGGAVCDKQSTAWQAHAAVDIGPGSSGIAVAECEVAGSGSYAVWARSNSAGAVVRDSYLRELGAGGLRIGSDEGNRSTDIARGVTVTGNVVRRGGLDFASGTGILVQFAEGANVSHNEVGFLAYAGISVGWSWDFARPSGTAGISVVGNYIHDLGTGLFRQLGDAMAAIYTLGVQPGTVVSGNFGHDVYAFYTGGYGLSQDQGSSEILFENNVLYRINAAPQTQHYGTGNTYRNNIFAGGMADSLTPLNSPALRTVPQPGLPNSFAFERNLVVWYNASNDALAFNGEYLITPESAPHVPGSAWHYNFTHNLYWDAGDPGAAGKPIWGGCTRTCAGRAPFKLSWKQWTGGCGTSAGSSPSNCTGTKQDQGSVVADPLFANPAAFDFSLGPSSPAKAIGFVPIDLDAVGIP